ncbi:MAG: hypothetical protein J6Z23_04180, partial [Lachnospiraceae bacterium]|nr:hypothetical protein [Lachnospiraceae bacterium]
MSALDDYLDWRGDLGFLRDPFNEVDNLILAELSYVRFEDIVPEGFGQAVGLREAGARVARKFGMEPGQAPGALPGIGGPAGAGP